LPPPWKLQDNRQDKQTKAPAGETPGFFHTMITLRKGTTQTIYFTGTEKATLTAPRFLFVFTHRASGEVVKVNVANTSTTERYDSASIVVNNLFTNSTEGLWSYIIRQKASNDSSTTESGAIVESGYMTLLPATDFAPTEYTEQSNEFVIYAGQ